MVQLLILLYSIAFSLLTNAFLFTDNVFLLAGCILAFVAINLLCGFFVSKSKSKRLKLLCHGFMLLIAFCFSAAVSVALHLLVHFQIISIGKTMLIHSVVYCVVCNAIVFWNGIVSVYLTSVRLGIKIRVVGLLCGLIPVVNIITLCVIIAKTYSEYFFEYKKETVNAKRKEQRLCQTKYPILLVHGVFFRDNKLFNYWGRVPRELEKNGATCFYGKHQSARAVKYSGRELSRRIKEIIEETGCEKVNIIAHSKGGLDCRYALVHCGVADCVASLTTVNTPHRGCLFAEWLFENISPSVKDKIASAYNKAAKRLGDDHPDFLAAVSDLKADVCSVFDKETPMPEDVYCQSVGSVLNKARSGKFPLNLSYRFVKRFDGKNDGLVGIDSFQWGENFTLLECPGKKGISHADVIDLNRNDIKGFDVREFYVQLVYELKQKGF